jgi:predicted amidohydrolase YtcJ
LLKDFSFGIGNFVNEIYSERPLFIANYDYHSALCNSLALERSGLNNRLSEFLDSEIVRDSNGNPVGIIKENALDFLFENLPKPGIQEKAKAAHDFIKLLHSYGITSVSDITLIEDLDVYNALFEDNKLKIRVNSYIPFEEFPQLEKHINHTKNIDPDFYSINGFKAYYDGSLGSETALFSKNYKGKNHNGYKTDTVTSGTLTKLAYEIDNQNQQMIIHAIGDLAVTEVLDLYESISHVNGLHERRHRIEHAQHIQEEDFVRFKQLGVIASAQPMHLKYDIPIVKSKLPDELINTT